MDMFSGDDFQEKLDLSNNDVSIAKGDWLHLEMNLRTVVDDGKFYVQFFFCPVFDRPQWSGET